MLGRSPMSLYPYRTGLGVVKPCLACLDPAPGSTISVDFGNAAGALERAPTLPEAEIAEIARSLVVLGKSQVAGDYPTHDLAGSLADLQDLRVPVIAGHGKILHVALSPLPQEVPLRHAAVVERDLVGVRCPPADLAIALADFEARCPGRDDDRRDLLLARLIGFAGHRGYGHQAGDLRPRVRDEGL